MHDWGVTLMKRAAVDMAAVLEGERQLGDFGFGVFLPPSKTPKERAAELRRQREIIRDDRALGQFLAARLWLRRFDKIKAPSQIGSSYGLKHVAEAEIGYTTNGAFIAAAIAEGFIVRRVGDGPNALLNISTQAWNMSDRNGRLARLNAIEADADESDLQV
jgi:hypothetical protein